MITLHLFLMTEFFNVTYIIFGLLRTFLKMLITIRQRRAIINYMFSQVLILTLLVCVFHIVCPFILTFLIYIYDWVYCLVWFLGISKMLLRVYNVCLTSCRSLVLVLINSFASLYIRMDILSFNSLANVLIKKVVIVSVISQTPLILFSS